MKATDHKILILFLVFLVFSINTYAFTDGQQLTQEQINNVDVNGITFASIEAQITDHSVEDSSWGKHKNYVTEITRFILTVENDTYILRYKPYDIKTPLVVWKNMYQKTNATYTLQQYNKMLYKRAYFDLLRIRKQVLSYQDDTDYIKEQDIIIAGDNP